MSEIYIDTQSVQLLAQEIACAIRGGLEVDPEQERRARIRARATAIFCAILAAEIGPMSNDSAWNVAYDQAAAGELADARFLAAERKEQA